MSKDLVSKKPEADYKDYAYAIVKGGIATIPIGGDVAAEVLSLIVASPLEKRKDEWVDEIAQGLVDLQEQFEELKLEDLSGNEVFITTMMKASQASIRNHQKEKLKSLRNAVLNSALPNAPNEDLQLIFINLIDELTTWHVRVLKLFDNPVKWAEENDKPFPSWITGPITKVLGHAYPELAERGDFYRRIFKDLDTYGLAGIPSGNMTKQGMMASRTTTIGKQFLKFIEDPLTLSG